MYVHVAGSVGGLRLSANPILDQWHISVPAGEHEGELHILDALGSMLYFEQSSDRGDRLARFLALQPPMCPYHSHGPDGVQVCEGSRVLARNVATSPKQAHAAPHSLWRIEPTSATFKPYWVLFPTKTQHISAPKPLARSQLVGQLVHIMHFRWTI